MVERNSDWKKFVWKHPRDVSGDVNELRYLNVLHELSSHI